MQALTPRVALQGPSDLSLLARATPAMEVRDTDTGRARSLQMRQHFCRA